MPEQNGSDAAAKPASRKPPTSPPPPRPAQKTAQKDAQKAGPKPVEKPAQKSTQKRPTRPTRVPGTSTAVSKSSATAAPTMAPTAPTGPDTSPIPVVPQADRRAASRTTKAAGTAATAQPTSPKSTRKARLRLTRVDPWSVMKTSFLLSIALGIVVVVAIFMVWSVLDAAGVWGSINQTVADVVGGQDRSTFDIEDYLGTRRVVGFAMIVSAVDVVLITAIATLCAFLYNMSASLLGGIEVTLAEDR